MTIEGKLPVDYGAGGVRFVVANQETVQVFIQAEGGVGKVTSELRFFDRGTDVTDQIDVDIDQTKGALALSGGARALLGQALTAEVSFKWLNVLTDTETLKVNRLDFGFGVRF